MYYDENSTRKGQIMANFTNPEKVKQQYSDDTNLSVRKNLHEKYSTNKKGFSAWLWEQYGPFDNCRILELGCGNGAQWENKAESMPDGCNVILTDFSDGMVNIVKEKYAAYPAFSFHQTDIQDIGFTDETFDIIIANHMMYHVPDIPKALSEVRRVLKPGGKFYASTIGSGGLVLFLHETFKRFNPDTGAFKDAGAFTLQNGLEILREHFSDVERRDYIDSLAVTKTQDLMDWVNSAISMIGYPENELDEVFEYLESIRKMDGAINIPKEAGLFVARR
jgi:ubiquinone/menaquinone biosynthesis C-methylase UbiE